LYQFLNYATMAATVDLNTNEIIELKPMEYMQLMMAGGKM